MKTGIDEILQYSNKVNMDPISRISFIQDLSMDLRAFAIMPKEIIEQMLLAEQVEWDKGPEITEQANKLVGEEVAKLADHNRDRVRKLTEIFLNKIQPVLIQACKEAGFNDRFLDED